MSGSEEYLFVYGTLLDASLRQWIFGRVPPDRADRLPGYEKLERSVADAYPEVRSCADPGAGVDGLCLELSAAELARADAYETSLYYREKRELASGTSAWVYLAAAGKSPGE